MELLKEQIRAAQQNHQHYEERIQTIRQELDRRQQEAAGHEQEQEALKESLGEAAVRKKEAEEKTGDSASEYRRNKSEHRGW